MSTHARTHTHARTRTRTRTHTHTHTHTHTVTIEDSAQLNGFAETSNAFKNVAKVNECMHFVYVHVCMRGIPVRDMHVYTCAYVHAIANKHARNFVCVYAHAHKMHARFR